MTTPPPNPVTADDNVEPTRLAVFMSDAGQTKANLQNEIDWLQVEEIHQTSGSLPDYCVLGYDLGRQNQRIKDMQLPVGATRMLEVRTLDEDEKPLGGLLFWGEITWQQMLLNHRDEAVNLRATVQPYHFGSPITGIRVKHPVGGSIVTLSQDVVFNPRIDNVIEANRNNTYSDTVPAGDLSVDVWIDPESVRTNPARTVQGHAAELWSLEQAVNAVAFLVNRGESFIRNARGIAGTLLLAPAVENFTLRRGLYLPQALDALLQPHGFDWYVSYILASEDADEDTGDDEDDTDLVAQPTIVIYEQGVGPEKDLQLQPIGEAVDKSETNTHDLDVAFDLADLANEIVAHGGYQEREVTITLYRGWANQFDSLTNESDLAIDLASSGLVSNYWRLWVANEAGDYSGTRDEPFAIPSTALDLTGVFDQAVPKRRRLEKCLSRDPNGERRPPVLEWRASDSEPWAEVPPEWGYVLLEDQIGIRFTGRMPPAELFRGGDDSTAELRITGTVVGDSRLTATASRQDTSPNGRTVTLFLDVSDRFHDRARATFPSNLASAFHTEDLPDYGADETDDADALQDYVDRLQTVEQSAGLQAKLVLDRIDTSYKIGDLITKIDGRNISLNRNTPTEETKRYLQVTGLVHNYRKQTTELMTAAVAPMVQEREPGFWT